MPWTITRVPHTHDLAAPEAWHLHGLEQVSRACELALWGDTDLAATARYVSTRMSEQEYATRAWWVATADGATGHPDAVVGCAAAILPLRSNQHLADLDVFVHPAHRGTGLGGALLDVVEGFAREHGRTTAILASDHPGEPPADADGTLTAPTGSGRILAGDAPAAFALGRGYALEQAERYSVLDLPVDPALLDRLHRDAVGRAGGDYRLVTWENSVPERWVDDLAHLETRMSTDAPLGDLDIDEDPWDAARVRTYEAKIAQTGHTYLAVAAEHVPTGRLAGFTMVERPSEHPGVVYQEDTLVLAEHRGHRLGMLLKTALLERLPEHVADARRIHTWNAEENDHMLGINVALGFRPRGVCGLWQRTL